MACNNYGNQVKEVLMLLGFILIELLIEFVLTVYDPPVFT